MGKTTTLSSLSTEKLSQIFDKNSGYIEFVLQSTLRTNAELHLKKLLNQLALTNLHLSYKIQSGESYHIEIESSFVGTLDELMDVIYAFNDVFPEELSDKFISSCEDALNNVEEIETAFLSSIIDSALTFLEIKDWKNYFIEHIDVFEVVQYEIGEDMILYRMSETSGESFMVN